MIQVKITDSIYTIEETIFAPPAEDLFQITGKEMEGTLDGHLSMPLLEKLSVTHNCSFHLKAYLYDYGGIEQCKFNIEAFFLKPTTENETPGKKLLLIAPDTSSKKAKTTNYEPEKSSNPEQAKNTTASSDDMEEESEQNPAPQEERLAVLRNFNLKHTIKSSVLNPCPTSYSVIHRLGRKQIF